MKNHQKIIFLIRHGQTEFNNKNIFRGHIDVPLDNSEIKALFPELYFEWETNPYKTKIPGGESLYDAEKRSWLSLKRIISKNENQIICIITHRVICKLLICKILGISKSGFWKIKQDTGCINIIGYADRKFSVLKLNYNSKPSDLKNSLKVMDF